MNHLLERRTGTIRSLFQHVHRFLNWHRRHAFRQYAFSTVCIFHHHSMTFCQKTEYCILSSGFSYPRFSSQRNDGHICRHLVIVWIVPLIEWLVLLKSPFICSNTNIQKPCHPSCFFSCNKGSLIENLMNVWDKVTLLLLLLFISSILDCLKHSVWTTLYLHTVCLIFSQQTLCL